MLVFERQQKILEILKENKSITVEELCRIFFISGATARRDLDQMAKEGMIKRTHGGAVLIDGNAAESPFYLRESENYEAKLKIAREATKFIKNGQTIFMDSSSTVLLISKFLENFEGLTVITNGIKTAMELAKYNKINIYSTGGKLRENSFSLTGTLTNNFYKNFYADILFLSCRGFDSLHGVTEANVEEAQTKREMIKNAKKTVLLCDSTKIGNYYLSKVCGADDISVIITDKNLSKNFVESLNELKAEVFII